MTSIDDALAALDLYAQTWEGLAFLSAIPNEDYDESGALTDVIQVTYSIIGRPGVYTVSVPYEDNWPAVANFYAGIQAQYIELIYEGADNDQQTPTVLLVPQQAPEGQEPPGPVPRPGDPIPV